MMFVRLYRLRLVARDRLCQLIRIVESIKKADGINLLTGTQNHCIHISINKVSMASVSPASCESELEEVCGE